MRYMKKEKNKKVTLEGLARMVAEGFDEINGKMATKEEMNSRFDSVEQRLGKVEYRVDEIYEIVVDREKDVLDLQVRVNKLEDNVKILNKQL